MSPSSKLVLGAVVLCGLWMLASHGTAGPASVGRGSENGPSEPVEASRSRHWSSARPSLDGSVLDAEWFARRRAVVYLVPDGPLPTFRPAATAVIRDRWTEGDWSLKHVFVSAAGSKWKFMAGQRLGVRDAALEVTRASGQPDSFAESTEAFVRRHVFFVHDPEGTAWEELLGDPDGPLRPTVVLLDYGGRVVETFELGANLDRENAEEEPDRLAEEVRRLLPVRPELGG